MIFLLCTKISVSVFGGDQEVCGLVMTCTLWAGRTDGVFYGMLLCSRNYGKSLLGERSVRVNQSGALEDSSRVWFHERKVSEHSN